MDRKKDLTNLLKLVGDDSPVVRKEVIRALSQYGPALVAELVSLPGPPTEAEIDRITMLLAVDDVPNTPPH